MTGGESTFYDLTKPFLMGVIHPELSKCHTPALFICITSKASYEYDCIDLVGVSEGTRYVDTVDSISVKALPNPLSGLSSRYFSGLARGYFHSRFTL